MEHPRPPHSLLPCLKRQALNQAAKQTLRQMTMGIDEGRHDNHIVGVNVFTRREILLRRLFFGEDGGDGVTLHRHHAIINDAMFRIRRHNRSTTDDKVIHDEAS